MKKLISLALILVICISTASCGFITDLALSEHALALANEAESVKFTDYSKDEGYKSFLLKLEIFSANLTEKLCAEYGEENNIVVSPISVYMALSLACECADGETRQEILDAVGVTYDEVNQYANKLYAFANVDYRQMNALGAPEVVAFQELSNSIWLDDSVSFKQGGVNKLASEYNCDVYQASFANGEAARLINKYIENKSRGLIDGDVELSPETYFVLMNTYYLKEIWNDTGRNLSLTDEKIYFQNRDGSTTHTQLLVGYYKEGKAYDGEEFSSFYTTTEHGFRIYFFVPDEEWDLNHIFTAENISTVLNLEDWGYVDDENMQLHHTRVLFPEFEAEFSEDIKGILANDFGIEALFDPQKCDMSGVTDENVYCQGVIHKAALKVDRTGIEGAAVTIMPMAGAAAPPPYEKVYHDFTVNCSFGFVMTDTCGTVVFSGVINNID